MMEVLGQWLCRQRHHGGIFKKPSQYHLGRLRQCHVFGCVLRAISRDVESIEILFQDLATTAMQDEQLKQELQNLFQLFQQTPENYNSWGAVWSVVW